MTNRAEKSREKNGTIYFVNPYSGKLIEKSPILTIENEMHFYFAPAHPYKVNSLPCDISVES